MLACYLNEPSFHFAKSLVPQCTAFTKRYTLLVQTCYKDFRPGRTKAQKVKSNILLRPCPSAAVTERTATKPYLINPYPANVENMVSS